MGGPQGAEAITPVPLQGQLALCLHSPHAYSNDELDLFILFRKKVKRVYYFVHYTFMLFLKEWAVSYREQYFQQYVSLHSLIDFFFSHQLYKCIYADLQIERSLKECK